MHFHQTCSWEVLLRISLCWHRDLSLWKRWERLMRIFWSCALPQKSFSLFPTPLSTSSLPKLILHSTYLPTSPHHNAGFTSQQLPGLMFPPWLYQTHLHMTAPCLNISSLFFFLYSFTLIFPHLPSSLILAWRMSTKHWGQQCFVPRWKILE